MRRSPQTLERRVGAALFSRRTRSAGLTEAGQQLLADGKPAADMFQAGLDAARGLGEQLSGHLRINAPRQSVSMVCSRTSTTPIQIPNTNTKYKSRTLDEDELIDIVEQGFDAGIRLGHTIEVDNQPVARAGRFKAACHASYAPMKLMT